MFRSNTSLHHQRGATLMVSLVVLLLMTVAGVSSMKISTLEERMSANLQNTELGFQSAESALREGEAWVDALTSEPLPRTSCSTYPCVISLVPNAHYENNSASWWTSNAAGFTSGTISGVAAAPRYIIEFYRFVPDTPAVGFTIPTGMSFYRITSRGAGATPEAVTVLEATISRRF